MVKTRWRGAIVAHWTPTSEKGEAPLSKGCGCKSRRQYTFFFFFFYILFCITFAASSPSLSLSFISCRDVRACVFCPTSSTYPHHAVVLVFLFYKCYARPRKRMGRFPPLVRHDPNAALPCLGLFYWWLCAYRGEGG